MRPRLPYLADPVERHPAVDVPTSRSFREYRNLFRGERIFLMGNGASLLALLAQERTGLGKEFTFASGRYVWWKERITPTFYFIGEAKHTEQWQEMGLGQPDVVLVRFWVNWQPPPPGWVTVPRPGSEGTTVANSGFQGFSETYVEHHRGRDAPLDMFQIAAWMGFRTMYLLGCENTMQGHVWNPKEDRTTGAARPSLVAPLYRQANELLGGRLYDCTPGGTLPETAGLTYVPLEEVLWHE